MRGGAIACVVVALGAVGPAVLDRLDRSWQQFTRLEPIQDQSRLVSGGGNRYDLWRVAIDQFASAPLGGVGAGNYYKTYFVERRSSEDVRQAHSIELQVAGETGLLGLVALAIFVLGIAVALVRARPVARKAGIERALLVGATGTTLYWLLHTSVDWMHLLPSITGMALAGIAVIGGAAAWPPPTISRRNPWTPLVFAAAILAVAGLGVSLMADRYRGEARESLSDRPQQAAARAEEAIQLDSSSIEGYVILAAAQARENRYAEARATLLAATRREPSNFVPWTLLGDLATRRGERADARAFYRRALALNPRDPSLKGLVR
jgi:O-antigen ligase